MAKFSDVDWQNEENTFRASFSGGKDSTALVLMLLEKGYPLDSIDFLDSQWEYPQVYEHIEKFENYIKERWGMTVNRLYLKEEWRFERWFYGKFLSGKFKGRMRGFPYISSGSCYLSRQKGRTLDRYDKTSYRYIGIGWNEKHRYTEEPKLLYPLIEWEITEDDCIEYLKKKDMLPTYNKYFKRNGCWWCPWQPLSSLRSLYILYPEKWAQLKVWEAESPHGYRIQQNLDELEERFNNEIENGEINLEDYK